MLAASTIKKKARDRSLDSTIQTTTDTDTTYINEHQNKKNKKSNRQPSQPNEENKNTSTSIEKISKNIEKSGDFSLPLSTTYMMSTKQTNYMTSKQTDD